MRKALITLFLALPLLVSAKGPKNAMDSFRYEIHREGKSSVCYIHKTDKGTSLYYRPFGSNEGLFLLSVDKEALNSLSKICRKNKLSTISGTSLSEEDKTRERWVAELSYGADGKHSIIEYYGSERSEKDIRTEDEIIGFFNGLIEKETATGIKCRSSKCIWSENGKLLKRIDYEADGTVRGGYDAFDPFARF